VVGPKLRIKILKTSGGWQTTQETRAVKCVEGRFGEFLAGPTLGVNEVVPEHHRVEPCTTQLQPCEAMEEDAASVYRYTMSQGAP
jgi:hypothetical protein